MKRRRIANGRQYYHQDLLKAMGRFLPRRGLPLVVADGRVRWAPRLLVTCAVMLG